MSGMMNIGKSKSKVLVEKDTGVTFAGVDELNAISIFEKARPSSRLAVLTWVLDPLVRLGGPFSQCA